jgi:hypothetical protein
MLRFLFILSCILFCGTVFAQRQLVVKDSSDIEIRNFNPSAIEKYKADPAFRYDMVHEATRSWWANFWRWLWQKIDNIFETETGMQVTKTMFIIIAIIVLVMAVLALTGMGKAGLFGKKNKEDALGYAVLEDDIHAIDFNAAIADAVNERNYRFAVRLLYLQTLKNLTDAGLINWQLNKTNITYVNELNGNEYQQNFRNLTRQFESNWYGDLPIELTEFTEVREQFNQFNKTLS